jgi:hypothetical protein
VSCIHTFLTYFLRPLEALESYLAARPNNPQRPQQAKAADRAAVVINPAGVTIESHAYDSSVALSANSTSLCIQIPADAATPAPLCGRYAAEIGRVPGSRFAPVKSPARVAKSGLCGLSRGAASESPAFQKSERRYRVQLAGRFAAENLPAAQGPAMLARNKPV